MTSEDSGAVDAAIAAWRARAGAGADADRLEAHLRETAAALRQAGLDADEAALIALRRLGVEDAGAREAAQERLGAALDAPEARPTPAERTESKASPDASASPPASEEGGGLRELVVVLALAAGAGAAIKAPELFGLSMGDGDDAGFYGRNLSLFVLPFLVAYVAWKRWALAAARLWLAAPFVAAALIVNVYPFESGGETEMLVSAHLPLALWAVVGLAHAGGRWRSAEARTHFIRFTGEGLLYYALIALGGGIFALVAWGLFNGIGVNIEDFATQWLLPCGASGAVIVAAWFAEWRRGVMAIATAALTRVFTPLFAAMLVVFLAAMAVTGRWIDVDSDGETLFILNLLLVIVLALSLFALSTRDAAAPPGMFDALQLALAVTALVVAALALAGLWERIADMGFNAGRTAFLGENLAMMVNFALTAWLYARFLRGRARFPVLARWQTSYLGVYVVWSVVVVAAFPLLYEYS